MKLAVLACQENLFTIAIPAQIIDLKSSFKEAEWGYFAQMGIIDWQEEQRASCISDDYHTSFPIAFYLYYFVPMHFECLYQNELFILQAYKPHNPVWKANHKHSSVVLLRERKPFDTSGLTLSFEFTMIKLFPISIVPKPDCPVVACRNEAII